MIIVSDQIFRIAISALDNLIKWPTKFLSKWIFKNVVCLLSKHNEKRAINCHYKTYIPFYELYTEYLQYHNKIGFMFSTSVLNSIFKWT